MDEYLKELNALYFHEWILGQKEEGIQIYKNGDHEIILETKYAKGHITFHEYAIMELSVDNLINGDNDFYLHFQFNSFTHSIELYHEMVDCIQHICEKPVLKVMLSCSSGLTTSLYASMLTDASKVLGLNYEFNAVAVTELVEAAKGYDVILLAPQIAYQYARIKAMMKNKLVLKIPPQIFAKYDAGKGLQFIQEEVEKSQKEQYVAKVFDIGLENHKGFILSLGLIQSQSREIMRLLARVYDEENTVLDSKESRKKEITMQDICDMAGAMIAKYSKIIHISLAIPGIVEGGKTHWSAGFDHINIVDELKNKFNCGVTLCNDLNAVVSGYSLYEKNFASIAYIYQPLHAHAGIGIIQNHTLITGHMNIAGEIKFVPLNLSDDSKKLSDYAAGTLELMGKTVATTIAMTGVDLIVFYSELIPDVEDLINEVERYIPQQYLPQIRKSHHMSDYICAGALLLGLENLKK